MSTATALCVKMDSWQHTDNRFADVPESRQFLWGKVLSWLPSVEAENSRTLLPPTTLCHTVHHRLVLSAALLSSALYNITKYQQHNVQYIYTCMLYVLWVVQCQSLQTCYKSTYPFCEILSITTTILSKKCNKRCNPYNFIHAHTHTCTHRHEHMHTNKLQ